MKFDVRKAWSEGNKPKLSKRDGKLLQLLLHNARTPISRLAKEMEISSAAVIQKIKSLTERGILLDPVLYTSFKIPENENAYFIQVYTQIGLNTYDLTERIKKIKGVEAALWYSGDFNLFLVSFNTDPQEVVERLEKIVPVNKIRISKIRDMWFHPPHIFEEVKNLQLKWERIEPQIDEKDQKIISYLNSNPRANLVDICEDTTFALATVKKRIKSMEKSGAIMRYAYYLNPFTVNRNIISVSFICKGRKNTDELLKRLYEEYSEVGNVWELDGEWNVNVVFWVKEQVRVNEILQDVYKNCKGVLNTEIMILSGWAGK